MDVETLEEFGIAPGRARENITTRGIALEKLSLGQRLRAGEALLEVTQAMHAVPPDGRNPTGSSGSDSRPARLVVPGGRARPHPPGRPR